MQIPPTRDSSSSPRLHRDDATDDVERALAILRATPYGPDATEEQEWACRLLYRTLLGRLSGICRRLGLDDEEVANVVHPELHQFFTRDVRRSQSASPGERPGRYAAARSNCACAMRYWLRSSAVANRWSSSGKVSET